MSDLNTADLATRHRYRKEGRELEQERIIKLLEAERWVLPNGFPAGGQVYVPLEEAIALIKKGKEE